ncbi:MAG: putative Ig domain-containing protein, partial [Vulcanococcus sp.]
MAEKVVIEGRFQDPSGDGVQLDVLVTDTRHDGLGLIGLELDLLWKSDAMELEQINLTPSLPLFRDTGNLDAAAGSLSGLVAASLPSSGNGEILGDSWRESFAQLNYRLLTNGEEGPDLTIIPRNYPARGNATLSAEQVVVVDSQSRPIPVLFGLAQQAQVGEHRLLLQAIDNSGRTWEQTLLLNVLNVNDSPKAIAIDPIEILQDEAFTINLADAFQDDDVSVGDSLTYQLSRGAPEWLVLDERSGLLSGQASNSEVGHWQIGVEAQDQSGATTQQTVKLVVINTNDAPLWNGKPLPEIWVRQDRPFEIRLPEQSISDVDAGDQLSYSFDLQNAEQLASLLTIDAESGTISGLIPAGETQLLNIKLVATDLAGESAAVPLRLKVVDRDFNRSPYRIGPELEQIILQEGDRFQLDFGVLFQDDDILIGDQLRFEVEAPDWLEVDPQRNRLSGSTDNDSVGEHRIRLQAIDQAGALAEKRFLLQVENINQAPFYLDGAFD